MTSARTLPDRVSAPAPSPRHAAPPVRFAWGVLGYNIAVVLWGGLVRATSSGAGCGDHWPLCNGVLIQAHPRMATIVELTHRVTSGVTVLAVLALLGWTFRATPRRHLARIAAAAAAVLTFNEALLGALLVLLQLTADNRSAARAVYLALHLANTFLLLAALTLTAHFLARGDEFRLGAVRFPRRGVAPAALALGSTLLVGVSGSLAALGDTLFPAGSLRAAFAQDFSGAGNWLLRLRILHPAGGLIAGVFIGGLVLRLSRGARPTDRRLATAVGVLLALQYALGLADALFLAPVWMQIVHLLGADLLWVTLVVLTAGICLRARPATALEGIFTNGDTDPVLPDHRMRENALKRRAPPACD